MARVINLCFNLDGEDCLISSQEVVGSNSSQRNNLVSSNVCADLACPERKAKNEYCEETIEL